MSTTLPAYSIITEGRVRRSCGSLEWQTTQSQPRVGTPMDVPLPSTVSVALMSESSCFDVCADPSSSTGSSGSSGLGRTRQSVRDLYIGHAYFVKAVLQKVLFGRSQVALGFVRQQGQSIDGLARADDVQARLLPLLVHQSQLQHRGHVQRCQEAL